MSINNVTIMGRLTFNPELKQTNSGVSVVRFQVACDRNYQTKGEERKADFIDCLAWRGTADFISKYFEKGSPIALTGSIQTRDYTDKDNNKRKAVEVLVSSVSFCGGTKGQGGNNASAPATKPQAQPQQDYAPSPELGEEFDDDDLPF